LFEVGKYAVESLFVGLFFSHLEELEGIVYRLTGVGEHINDQLDLGTLFIERFGTLGIVPDFRVFQFLIDQA